MCRKKLFTTNLLYTYKQAIIDINVNKNEINKYNGGKCITINIIKV